MRLTDQQLTDIAEWAENNLDSESRSAVDALVAEVRERRAIAERSVAPQLLAGLSPQQRQELERWAADDFRRTIAIVYAVLGESARLSTSDAQAMTTEVARRMAE